MAKRAELDPNSVTNLFKRTEPDDEGKPAPSPAKDDAAEESKVETKNAEAEPAAKAKTPRRKRTTRKSSAASTNKSGSQTSYDLVRLMAVGGKWVYLTQITDPEPILAMLEAFDEEFEGKYAVQKAESALGMVGYIALSNFEAPLTSGDAFRWFAAELAHSGWEPFFAEQSSPNIPAHQYRDAIYFRLAR